MSQNTRDQYVVEIAGSLAGHYAGRLFCDAGARVVQLRPESGIDEPIPPHLDAGKQVETLASDPEQRSLQLKQWLSQADIAIESAAPEPLSPEVPEEGFENLIRVRISPFDSTGPYSHYRSNAFTDEAFGGQLFLNGESDREPLVHPEPYSHYQAGLHGFIGALSALHARAREGSGQSVAVNHFEGMVSLHQHTLTMWSHGGHVLRRQGNHQPGFWHPSGVYPCLDGHVMLVLSASAHRDRFLVEADIPEILADPRFADDMTLAQNKKAFDEAIAPWLMAHRTDEIIELAARSGVPVGRVASPLEVLANPHLIERGFWKKEEGTRVPGRAFQIHERVEARSSPSPETSPPKRPHLEKTTGTAPPLDRIRILDLSRIWAGPLAGRILADLGADVIRIEAPDARGGKETPPELGPISHLFPENEVGKRPWNRIGSLNKLGRNKRSLTLDLKKEEARHIFKELIREVDVVIENFQPRVLPQLGLGFDQLSALNPSLIYTSISGYGVTGPHANRAALGPTIEAESGAAFIQGYPDSGPYRSGVAWADPLAGLHAVAATLIALNDRACDPEPRSRLVEISMLESALAILGDPLSTAQKQKKNPKRKGNRDSSRIPQGVYPCKGSDEWIALSIENDLDWKTLCRYAGLSHWSDLTREERHQNIDEIEVALAKWTRLQAAHPLEARLQTDGLIAAALRNGRDLYDDPQLSHGPFWARTLHPEAGAHAEPGCPIRLEKTPASYRRPAACLGENNEEVLTEILHADPIWINRLKSRKILTEEPP